MINEITYHPIVWSRTLVGLALCHDPSKTYGEEITAGLGPVWGAVRGAQVGVTGINHVFYGADHELFCGLECSQGNLDVPGLETRRIELGSYVYVHYNGPYEGLGEAYDRIRLELADRGLRPTGRALEIYGHWSEDPAQLVTEIVYGVTSAGQPEE